MCVCLACYLLFSLLFLMFERRTNEKEHITKNTQITSFGRSLSLLLAATRRCLDAADESLGWLDAADELLGWLEAADELLGWLDAADE